MTTKNRAGFIFAAMVSLPLAPGVRGDTYTWSSGSSVFSNPGAWSGGVVPPSDAKTVLHFGALNQTYTATNDTAGGFTLNSIVFVPPAGNPFVTHSVNGTPMRFVPSGDVLPSVVLPGGSFYSMLGSIDAPVVLDHTTHFTNTHQSAVIRVDGQITGSGRLVLDGTGTVRLNGNNTYTGGTQVLGGILQVGTGATLGSGGVTVGGGAGTAQIHMIPAFQTPAAPANSIMLLPGTIAVMPMAQEHIDSLHPSSGGVVSFNGNLNAINLTGRNDLRIGYPTHTTSPFNYYLDITPANNTYRFGGKLNYVHDLASDDGLVISSRLTDGPGGTPRSVNIGPSGQLRGGKIHIGYSHDPSNTYTGGTVVEANTPAGLTALAFNYTPQPGKTPLGSGPVTVYGTLMFEAFSGALGSLPNEIRLQPGSVLMFNNARGAFNRWPDNKPVLLNGSELAVTPVMWNTSTANETVGPVQTRFHSKITAGSTASSHATFQSAQLGRVENGTLHVHSAHAEGLKLGHLRGRVDPPVSTPGRPIPWIVGSDGSTAPTYVFERPDGALVLFENYLPNFSFSATEVVDLTSSASVNTETAWALRMRAVGDGPDPVLTIDNSLRLAGGGLMIDGHITGGVLSFQSTSGPSEGIVYVPSAGTISSRISAPSGLTKFGPGTLHLMEQNLVAHRLTINQGSVALHAENALALNSVPADVLIGPGASLEMLADQQFRYIESVGAFQVAPDVSVEALHVRAGSLVLGPGATMRIRQILPGPWYAETMTSRLRTLEIQPTARFDLTTYPLVVDGGDMAAIQDLIADGRLMSSIEGEYMTMVALRNDKGGGNPFFNSLGGLPVDADDVLVRYTLLGDANLSGRVDAADYLAIDRGRARNMSGWPAGDFNDDGKIDGADYFLIDRSYLSQFSAAAGGAAVVPEPGLALLLPWAVVLLGRRRRRWT